MIRRITRTIIAAGVCFFLVGDVQAVISLDADFDHGSLETWSLQGGSSVNLVGRDNFYGNNRWRWVYFEATGVQGVTPQFSISDNFAGGAGKLTSHPMVYSYDNENWQFFDNNGLNGNQFEFSNNSAFTQDQVFVAYSLPYSYGRGVAHTQQVLASPWAEPTFSGDANGVVGMSPGGVDDLGRVIAPREIYGYRVTNPATDGPAVNKRKIVITTGMHPAENLGRYTFQGLVDWLISDDPRAANLRDIAEVFAYPTMNPDGVFAGNNRATVENPNSDPNGFWNPSLWVGHEDIQVNGEAMLADVASTPGSVVDAFIDFHSTWPSSPFDDFGFIEIDQGDHLAPFWLELRELQPNVEQIDSTSTGWTSANFGDFLLNADVDITFETQLGLARNTDYYLNLGANFGIAFATTMVPAVPGDFDNDGDIDADDIDELAANFGNPSFDLTGDGIANSLDHEFLVQDILGTELGDADLDGDVDLQDFNALAIHFGQVGGWASGDFSANFQVNITDFNRLALTFGFVAPAPPDTLPEPASMALLVGAMLGIITRRRHDVPAHNAQPDGYTPVSIA